MVFVSILGTIGLLLVMAFIVAGAIMLWKTLWTYNDGFLSALEVGVKFVLTCVLIVAFFGTFFGGLPFVWHWTLDA